MKKNQASQARSGKKYRRIGQKVGNMVVMMQVASVIFAVAMCVIMELLTKCPQIARNMV